MNEYTSFIENNHIITGEFVGIMIAIDNIYNNQIYNYSYLFTTSNNITKHTFIKKPVIIYVVIIMVAMINYMIHIFVC